MTTKAPAPFEAIATTVLRARLAIEQSAAPTGINLCGIEPFAHPDLVRTLSTASQAGIRRVMVTTDGGALASISNARGCIGSGVRLFEVVFLGPDAAAHDRLSGVGGSFERGLAGLRNIREVAQESGARVVAIAVLRVCKHNRASLPTTVASIAHSGLVRAIRVAAEDGVVVEPLSLAAAVTEATTAGVAVFGDGLETHLCGASLYSFSDDAELGEVGV